MKAIQLYLSKKHEDYKDKKDDSNQLQIDFSLPMIKFMKPNE